MSGDQTSLFDQKKYIGILPQTYQIEPPAADQTVTKTLPAYQRVFAERGILQVHAG